MLEGVAWHEIICDDDGKPVDTRFLDINPAFEALTGLSRDEVVGNTIRAVLPGIEDEWIDIFAQVAFSGLQQTFEHFTVVFNRWYAVSVYSPIRGQCVVMFDDITERREADEALRRRDAVLNAIAFAAREFLSAVSWETPVNAVLARLGKAAEVSRMHIVANETDAEGRLHLNRRFAWVNAGAAPISNSSLLQNAAWDESPLQRWRALLAAGQVIAVPCDSLPERERAVVAAEGVRSILVVPIFAGRTWWGFISFDECAHARQWLPLEVDALKTAADILGAALARGESERTVAEQELRYRTLFDLSPSGIMLEDENGMILDVNAAVCETFGYEPEELVGRHVSCLVESGQQVSVAQHIAKILGGDVLHHEVSNRRKDGSLRDVELREIRVPLPDGRAGILVVANDVTTRRRQERQLREAERFLSSVFSSIQDGLSIIDRDLRIVRVNAAMERWYAHATPLVGKKCYEAYHCRTRPCPRCPSKFTLATGEPSHAVVPLTQSDGSHTGWVDLFTFPLHDADTGELTGVIEYVRDITDRRRAEEELRESEARQRTILNALPDLVFRLKRDTTCIDFSAPSEELLLVPPEQFMRRRLVDVLPTGVGELTQAHVEQTLNTGQPSIYQYELSKDGTLRTYEARMIMIADDEVLAIVSDITDRRKLEEELAKTQRLESLGLLAGGIAHDFNNILTTILGHISLAKMPDARQIYDNGVLLEEVERAAVRAKDLTRQLLTFSKGGAPVKRAASLTDIVIDSATFALRGSNSRCEFDLPDNLWPVEVDAGQISQVIQNLVINADQAMASGGTVRLRARNLTLTGSGPLPLPAGRYVEMTCHDTGAGIPEQFIEKIFDPYFTTKQKGSGLGLATTFSIIKKHGGHLTVDSRIGEGTIFAFCLPAATEVPRAAAPVEAALPELERGRVLFMDDEETIRSLVALVLGKAGYEVVLVEEGSTAVAEFREACNTGRPFDAVVLDLTIRGGMGGRETIAQLREIDPQVKAIVASGYSNDPVMARYQDFGFAGVVAKPFRAAELRAALRAVLDSA
jgi:PAS domain S-box-containing protein